MCRRVCPETAEQGKPTWGSSLQEARALRHLSVASPAAARHSVALRGTFTFKGHFCLVRNPNSRARF